MADHDVEWDELREATLRLHDTLSKISDDVAKAKKDMATLLNQINGIPIGKTKIKTKIESHLSESTDVEYKLLRLTSNDFNNFMDTIESDIKLDHKEVSDGDDEVCYS